jgi:phytoene dehydrogenase-like protein
MSAASAATFDAIVIGAGANGLVAAATLAKAGRRVLVLERATHTGGPWRSREFAPGFRAPLSEDAGWLPPRVARELGLALPMTEPEIAASVSDGAGALFSLPRHPGDATDAIRRHSARDAKRWSAFVGRLGRFAGFLGALYQLPPPDIDATALGDLLPMIGLGRRFRALGRDDMTELLRVLPMPVQDLLDDTFETAPLKALLGAGGVRDLRQGPRSGGTGWVLLHYLVGAPAGSARARAWWRGGPDAFTDAAEAAARRHGATIRTAAGVAGVVVRDDAVRGVVLASGEEIAAPVVLSTADPAHTLLGLVDPVWLDPDFLHAVRQVRFRGCTAVVRYALDRLPELAGDEARRALASVTSVTPTLDALERAYDAAKYGAVSRDPHVEFSMPSLRWPSLAPQGRHVLLARVQYAPHALRDGDWDDDASRALAGATTAAIARVLPRFADSVLHQEVLTPRDLESEHGFTEGDVTHGALMLDQMLFMRPVAGWGRYAMPVDGLYLGGAGAHPGPGILGGPGWLAAKRVLADGRRA